MDWTAPIIDRVIRAWARGEALAPLIAAELRHQVETVDLAADSYERAGRREAAEALRRTAAALRGEIDELQAP